MSARRKHALFYAALTLMVALAAEGLSLIALHALGGSLAEARSLRAWVATPDPSLAQAPTVEVVLHLYAGFVYNPDLGVPRNEFGLLGRSPKVGRAPGRVIIGITGGSLASHFGEDAERVLRPLLARSPRFQGKELVFLNLAVAGFHQPQQLELLAYLLAAGVELDVLVELGGLNEVYLFGASRDANSPLFPAGWAPLASRDPQSRAALGEIRYLWRLRRDWSELMSHAPLRWSVTANLIWWLRDGGWRRTIAEDREEIARRDAGRAERLSLGGPPYHEADEPSLYRDLVAQWKRSELLVAELCRANGIRYVTLLQPNQYLPGSKPMDVAERAVAWKERAPIRRTVELGYPLLAREGEELARRGIEFRDLSMVFAGEHEPLYIDDCCHLNARGNERLAPAVAAALLADPPR